MTEETPAIGSRPTPGRYSSDNGMRSARSEQDNTQARARANPMADKTYTEREKVLAEREAFEIGVMAAHADHIQCGKGRADVGLYVYDGHPYLSCDKLPGITRGRYPLPKVTRQRILRDDEVFGTHEFTVIGDEVHERRNSGSPWRLASGWTMNLAVVGAWAELLANPTEEVEAES